MHAHSAWWPSFQPRHLNWVLQPSQLRGSGMHGCRKAKEMRAGYLLGALVLIFSNATTN